MFLIIIDPNPTIVWVVWTVFILPFVYVISYTFRTAGAWLLRVFTFLYTFRTAGAANLVNSNHFLQVLYNGITHQKDNIKQQHWEYHSKL